MPLKKISLLSERIGEYANSFPFTVPAIKNITELEFNSNIVFFVGENGSGKSTLLESIAAHYGFGAEGGNRNFTRRTTDSIHAIDPLVRALRLSFTNRTGRGFFLRAESFFNIATAVDELGATDSYGGKSLHGQSHGESFLALIQNRFHHGALYLLDEPEAALSPARQLALLITLHQHATAKKPSQFIIATHSPILTAFPGAQILSFDGDAIHEIKYHETSAYQITSRFLANPQSFLKHLFAESDEPQLFESPDC